MRAGTCGQAGVRAVHRGAYRSNWANCGGEADSIRLPINRLTRLPLNREEFKRGSFIGEIGLPKKNVDNGLRAD